MGYTPLERLAIGTALKSKIDELIGTKDATNLRGEVDAEFIREFERTGERSFPVEVNGRKVGTMSVVTAKATPETRKKSLKITDADAYLEWAIGNGFIVPDDAGIKENFERAGEIPDGCEVVEVITPATDGNIAKGTRLRVDADGVIDALGGYIETGVAGVLESGWDGGW